MAWRGASASTWLRVGWFPSTLVWFEQSWASKLAAKACMAAWLSEANVFVDKTLAVGIRLWVASVNFSKTFARVHWPALWTTLLEQGISEHMISALCDGQFGFVPFPSYWQK